MDSVTAGADASEGRKLGIRSDASGLQRAARKSRDLPPRNEPARCDDWPAIGPVIESACESKCGRCHYCGLAEALEREHVCRPPLPANHFRPNHRPLVPASSRLRKF